MDLMQLGRQSRKTGIKPRKDLRRDEHNMEDIDDFFNDTSLHHQKVDSEYKITGLRQPGEPSETRKFKKNHKIPNAEPAKLKVKPAAFQTPAVRTSSFEDPLPKTGLRNPSDGEENEWDTEIPFQDVDFDDENHNQSSFESDTNIHRDAPRDHEHQARRPSPTVSPKRGPAVTKILAQKRPRKLVDINEFQDSSHNTSLSNDSTELSELSEKYPDSTTEVSRVRHDFNDEQGESLSAKSLPSPPPEGLRRSKRTKIAPLAFWRNERIVYSRVNENSSDIPTNTFLRNISKVPLQNIAQVIHVPEKSDLGKKQPRRRTRKQSSETMSQTKKNSSNDDSDSDSQDCEWYKHKSITTEIFDSAGNRSERVIAWSPEGGNFQPPSTNKDGSDNFQVASLFNSESDLFASGLLEFPAGGLKSLKNTKESSFVFHVSRGEVEVTINSETFTVKRGCSFEIPKYNSYSLRNSGRKAARLFFVQSQTPVD